MSKIELQTGYITDMEIGDTVYDEQFIYAFVKYQFLNLTIA